ncbi:hypothetical protein [Goodfellowiella coeruleoviolacea]|uniref:Uncharacterized protein n=1 Tax=Goodfellowiella coeruleoviolacea TaxID=334858 RepID=A0AAE3GMJ1_9PSEU|nr:hypothetical protein [Goodfellowiella coeruleoviolacea]MCP2170019.1 hypothetical protein [Goodfellowiella coeruleoviolacea]
MTGAADHRAQRGESQNNADHLAQPGESPNNTDHLAQPGESQNNAASSARPDGSGSGGGGGDGVADYQSALWVGVTCALLGLVCVLPLLGWRVAGVILAGLGLVFGWSAVAARRRSPGAAPARRGGAVLAVLGLALLVTGIAYLAGPNRQILVGVVLALVGLATVGNGRSLARPLPAAGEPGPEPAVVPGGVAGPEVTGAGPGNPALTATGGGPDGPAGGGWADRGGFGPGRRRPRRATRRSSLRSLGIGVVLLLLSLVVELLPPRWGSFDSVAALVVALIGAIAIGTGVGELARAFWLGAATFLAAAMLAIFGTQAAQAVVLRAVGQPVACTLTGTEEAVRGYTEIYRLDCAGNSETVYGGEHAPGDYTVLRDARGLFAPIFVAEAEARARLEAPVAAVSGAITAVLLATAVVLARRRHNRATG